MNCQVKKALFPFDDSSFWNDLYQFCKTYGSWIHDYQVKTFALSDQVGDYNLPLVEQPEIVSTYGAHLGKYTLRQCQNLWLVVNVEEGVVVASLSSWQDLMDKPDLDAELASAIKNIKEEKAKERKAFLDKYAPVPVAPVTPVAPKTIIEEIQEEDDYYW